MARAKLLDAYGQKGKKSLRFAVCGLRFAYFLITI
jgi:hypothetical protein